MSLFDTSHKRFNPLTGEWIMVSPHRLKRPWQGKVESSGQETRPAYDPQCYLCPGNPRAAGAQTPQYTGTYVFTNDFSALLPDSPFETRDENGLMVAHTENGICRVICFSPRHDLTLAQMDREGIREVVTVWTEQTADLAKNPDIGYVQIFENKGAIMGCSNPHPHGQIWATQSIPSEPMKEDRTQREYYEKHKSTLLSDYLKLEMESEDSRIICANTTWVALVPFWAKWPFEAMVLPRRSVGTLPELTEDEKDGLADILGRLTARFDNLFNVSFPYTMGIHQSPCDGDAYAHWHLHLHFYPPLLRSATVQKFMVGFEMLAEPQRDITPEQAAERLRDLSEIHYTKQV